MMPYENTKICKSYIVLCEGFDAQRFIIEYLNCNELKTNPQFSNNIQVFSFGGINDLKRYLAVFKQMEGFHEVSHLLILRDTETDSQKAVAMVTDALVSNDFPVPSGPNTWCRPSEKDKNPQIAFSLFPSCSPTIKKGALEDLCWTILKDEHAQSIQKDIQAFIEKIKKKYGSIKSHEHKSRVHTFFSINDKYVSLKVGEAAKAGAFDWAHKELSPLKGLIEDGFKSFS